MQSKVSSWGTSNWAPTTSTNSALSPNELLSVDKKMDDGSGTAGNIISGSVPDYGGGFGPLLISALSTCSNGSGVYQVQNTGYECTPLIRIGAQAGDPQ